MTRLFPRRNLLIGKPRIVHDRGSQFISHEWRDFVIRAGIADIKTRHVLAEAGNSASRVKRSTFVLWLSRRKEEQLHSTHREDGLTQEALTGYYSAWALWKAVMNTTTMGAGG